MGLYDRETIRSADALKHFQDFKLKEGLCVGCYKVGDVARLVHESGGMGRVCSTDCVKRCEDFMRTITSSKPTYSVWR